MKYQGQRTAYLRQIIHHEPVPENPSTRKSRRRALREYQRATGMTTQQIREDGIRRGGN